MSEARSWSNTPLCVAGGRDRTWQHSLLSGAGGGYRLQGELTSDWFIGYQGNQQRGMPLTTSLISYPGS